jgi:hypothetical protein
MPITNSPKARQNWLWQSEQFLIWNDGLSLPVIYDGTGLRRSNGASTQSIGNITADLTIPKVGEVVSSNTTTLLGSSYLKQSVLVGTSQFVITKIGGDTTASSINVTKQNILVGSASDQLLNAPPIQTVVYKTSNYSCYINNATAVKQGSTTITDWGQANFLAPTDSIGGTAATPFTMAIPANTAFDPNYNKQSLYRGMSVNDTILVNGYQCQVLSLTYIQGTSTYITSATCLPLTVAATGKPIFGTCTPVVHDWCTQLDNNGNCVYNSPRVSSNGAPFAVTGTGAMNGGTSGIPAYDNFFTVALNVTPDGLASGTQYTFDAYSTNLQACIFTGFVSGANLINCKIVQKPTSSAPINVVTGNPTSLNQYIFCQQGGTTSVGTIFATVNVSSISFQLSSGASVQSGQLLLAQPAVGETVQNYYDYFFVTAAQTQQGTTTNYVQLQNQTGVTGSVIPANTAIVPIPELPVGTIGVYGLGRNWMSLPDGKSYIAGDLVGSSSGTNVSPTNYRFVDAVLKVSQNQFLAGGQVNGTGLAFVVPGAGEKIRAMQFTAQLDTSIGQGPLQIFTDDTVFSNAAPADATTWAKLTSPIQTEGLIGSGAISQYAIAQTNGDLFFRLSDGGVQSMLMARLDFNKWGNTPISIEVSPIIRDDNPSLLPFTSMTTFDNRLLMTCKLVEYSRGVCGQSMVSLNFDPISNLSGKAPAIWEGEWTGINVLQFVTGFFNDAKQCYALCLSDDGTEIELYRILTDSESKVETNYDSFAWSFESPMMVVDQPSGQRPYKRLLSGEFSLTQIQSDVNYTVYYRSDQNPNWTYWYSSLIKYQGDSDPGYRRRVSLGSPSGTVYDPSNNSPLREGFNFQVKVLFSSPCMLTNFKLVADEVPEPTILLPI